MDQFYKFIAGIHHFKIECSPQQQTKCWHVRYFLTNLQVFKTDGESARRFEMFFCNFSNVSPRSILIFCIIQSGYLTLFNIYKKIQFHVPTVLSKITIWLLHNTQRSKNLICECILWAPQNVFPLLWLYRMQSNVVLWFVNEYKVHT